MDDDKKDPQTYAIIGAAMAVHSHWGHGFLESVYQEALALEFKDRDLPFRKEVALEVWYREHKLATAFRADFICCDEVIVEIKALSAIGHTEDAQLINYLKATGHERGLLLNFGAPKLQYRRLIFTKKKSLIRRLRR